MSKKELLQPFWEKYCDMIQEMKPHYEKAHELEIEYWKNFKQGGLSGTKTAKDNKERRFNEQVMSESNYYKAQANMNINNEFSRLAEKICDIYGEDIELNWGEWDYGLFKLKVGGDVFENKYKYHAI